MEGLDVVDFPGVDDRDETISDLADLLLTLAQIIVFVVDYRYISCANVLFHNCCICKLLLTIAEKSTPSHVRNG